MNNLKLTLKAWPVIAAATIGLCFLTQQAAKLFGIELPNQTNIEIVKQWAGWNWNFASLCFQILIVMPAIEECYFRHFIYRRSLEPINRRNLLIALSPTAAFLLIGCAVWFLPALHMRFPADLKASAYFTTLAVILALEYPLRVFLGRLIGRLSPWAILAVSAIVFSATHYLTQPFPDDAFLALFFFGLAQCWLYKKTGRLWCAMLNHGLFNLTNLVLLFVIPEAA